MQFTAKWNDTPLYCYARVATEGHPYNVTITLNGL